MKRLAVLLVFALLPIQLAWAQEAGTIVGTVTAQTGSPMAAARVTISGTRFGASTGADGRYTIAQVPPGTYVVRARLIGYTGGELPSVVVAGGDTVVADFQLQAQAIELNPIVATGYYQQEKLTLTSSIATASGAEVAQRPVANATDALQGLVPGLTIIDRGGRPGDAGTTVFIRGRGTLNRETPLTLIDGVPGDINVLDADDIESISVLKDAASAAIYGARAANGVIVVTTKRGANTNNIDLSYDAYYGVQRVERLPERVGIREYLEMINEAHVNSGLKPKYSQGYIDSTLMAKRGVPGVDPLRYPDTDWLGVLWNPAGIQDHTLRLTGGSDLASFAASVNYMDQQGMMANSGAKRTGLRLNTDFRPNQRFQAGLDVALRRNWDVEPHDAGGALFRMFHDVPPTIVPKYPDGTYGWSQNKHNPVAYAEATGRRTRENWHGTINARLDYQLVPGLTLRTLGSVQGRAWEEKDWSNQVLFPDYWDRSSILKRYEPNWLWQNREVESEIYLRGLVEYNRAFGDHAVGAMVGYEQTANDWEQTGARREKFYSNELQEINAGDPSVDDNFGRSQAWRLRSGFGRVTYGWREKYLFTANVRYDGSSRFAPGNRFGVFPAFSAGWRLSQEPFMRSVGFVEELKLRGSWGRTGNQSVRRGTTELYYPYWSTYELGQGYSFGDQLVNGAAQTTAANRDISWETTTMTDIGVDAVLFGGRLSFTGDVYRKDTRGILLLPQIPATIGLRETVQNLGKVRNTGWETALTYQAAAGGVNYSVGFNLSYNTNRIVDLAGTGPYFQGIFIWKEGLPIGTIWGLQADGLFRDSAEVAAHAFQHPATEPGDIRFVDQNRDGRIDNDDRVPIGSDMPSYTLGSTWTASYKGFDASVFFQGALDVDAYLEGALTEGPVWENYTVKDWLDHWTPTNLDAKMPKPRLRVHINHGPRSSFWVRDVSYIKLKTAHIGYALPQRVARWMGVDRVRVYASGQNLLHLSKVTQLLDPEFPSGRVTVWPQTRTFAFGTSVQF